MAKDTEPQTEGRKRNGAEPLGPSRGIESSRELKRTGKESRRRAGPDGPDATEVGDTFKRGPGKH
jgi:hypothetical protein